MNSETASTMDTDVQVKQEPDVQLFSNSRPRSMMSRGLNETNGVIIKSIKSEPGMEIEDELTSHSGLSQSPAPGHCCDSDATKSSTAVARDVVSQSDESTKEDVEKRRESNCDRWKLLELVEEKKGAKYPEVPALNFLKQLEMIVASVDSSDYPSEAAITGTLGAVIPGPVGAVITGLRGVRGSTSKNRSKVMTNFSRKRSSECADEAFSSEDSNSTKMRKSSSTELKIPPKICPTINARFPRIDTPTEHWTPGQLLVQPGDQPLDLSLRKDEASPPVPNWQQLHHTRSYLSSDSRLGACSLNLQKNIILKSLISSGASVSVRSPRSTDPEGYPETNCVGLKSSIKLWGAKCGSEALTYNKIVGLRAITSAGRYEGGELYDGNPSASSPFAPRGTGSVFQSTISNLKSGVAVSQSPWSTSTRRRVSKLKQPPQTFHSNERLASRNDSRISLLSLASQAEGFREEEMEQTRLIGFEDYNHCHGNGGNAQRRVVDDSKLNLLRCVECCELFSSLQELTLHMIRSQHYMNLVGGASFFRHNSRETGLNDSSFLATSSERPGLARAAALSPSRATVGRDRWREKNNSHDVELLNG